MNFDRALEVLAGHCAKSPKVVEISGESRTIECDRVHLTADGLAVATNGSRMVWVQIDDVPRDVEIGHIDPMDLVPSTPAHMTMTARISDVLRACSGDRVEIAAAGGSARIGTFSVSASTIGELRMSTNGAQLRGAFEFLSMFGVDVHVLLWARLGPMVISVGDRAGAVLPAIEVV